MIDQALQLVRDRLNSHLTTHFAVPEDLVSLSPLTDADGKPAQNARNRLVLFLTNIAHDPLPRNHGSGSISQLSKSRPIHLDIYFMVASGHDADIYGEGLKLISAALMFFQANPVMTPRNTPEMSAGIAQLTIEISNLRVEEMGQMWGNLGGRYTPSVMFKMRSVMIDAGIVTGIVPQITRPSERVTPKAETV